MPLHPQCAAIVEAAARAGAPFNAGDHLAVRSAYAASTPHYVYDPGPLASVDAVALGGVPTRRYVPQGAAPAPGWPCLVFFHGGGWAVGDLDSHDHLCRHLAVSGRFIVLSVDYRLAPEHKYPAAADDCLTATRAARLDAARLGIDPARIAVGGDSAGGNLAAVVAIDLRDADEQWLRAQLLIYPAVDFAGDTASMRENGRGYLLTREAMEMFTNLYLPDAASRTAPRASPLRAASHAHLPPAIVHTAEFDPLRDEGAAYAQALADAGVATHYQCYAGMIHGFARMGSKVDDGKRALDDAASRLAELLR